MPASFRATPAQRHIVDHAVDHLDHVLPGQAPIRDFVHHNTLHGYQHRPFEEAIAAAEANTGARGTLPETEFRRFYAQGRVGEADLEAALRARPGLGPDQVLARVGGREICRIEVCKRALLDGSEAADPARLRWELGRLDDPDLALWHAVLARLGIADAALHPETLADLPAALGEEMLARFHGLHAASEHKTVHAKMAAEALALLDHTLDNIGVTTTFREPLRALTGVDLLDRVRPLFQRLCAAHLDEGMAAWHDAERETGLYTWTRAAIHYDLSFFLEDLAEARAALEIAPPDSRDAIAMELTRLAIPESRWEGYLTRLALEIPGWNGQINWRERRTSYGPNAEAPPRMTDALALRLLLDGPLIRRICKEAWHVEGQLPVLHAAFEAHLSEFTVRHALYTGALPDFLAHEAREMVEARDARRRQISAWRDLADRVWTWQHAMAPATAWTAHGAGWRLFRLARGLGLDAAAVEGLSDAARDGLLSALDALDAPARGAVWLAAYERPYRERLLRSLAENHGVCGDREERPLAQVIFCIDDREEAFRRHLEATNPRVETLGAAGFFGLAVNWRGLDDTTVSPLCPIALVPVHELRERARPGAEAALERHNAGKRWRLALGDGLVALRRDLLGPLLAAVLGAPLALLSLAGRVLAPRAERRVVGALDRLLVPRVPTEVAVNAVSATELPTPTRNRLGMTDTEQADRVAGLLRNIGLSSGLAPLIVLMGHGSDSQNNPHLAAYDCGACSGRHGGPNARAFAAMANRPAVRALLRERGVTVPDDVWFVGADHNTADESITWFDLEDLPATHRERLAGLQRDLQTTATLSAVERCRRFASAPENPTPEQALRHVATRGADFSQARPELGHATNAAALVGRRAMSRGLFLDRRAFLISYDPGADPEGALLEGILLAVGPVCAGISLEYYFSTVDDERYGCGTKVPHNIVGLFGVMEGGSSDLRTGLPRQMIEIHEAMRLQLVVEAKAEVLSALIARQASLRELVDNAWIHLVAKDPSAPALATYVPGRGFVPWVADA